MELSPEMELDWRSITYLGKPLLQATGVPGDELKLLVAKGTNADELSRWFRKQAAIDFGKRLRKYADKLEIDTPKLLISDARKRWGSCDHKGVVRLAWRLLMADMRYIDFVVAHELTHLSEWHHTPAFYEGLSRALPDHRARKAELDAMGPDYCSPF